MGIPPEILGQSLQELANLKANFTSLEATRQRHVGSSPNLDRYDPDSWNDEYAFLTRPGQADIQTTLFLDYRTNVASYPLWQQWLRQAQPPTLVVWGKYDPSFTVAGATAYGGDVPSAEIHLLDAGHFALDEATDEIGSLVHDFLDRLNKHGRMMRAGKPRPAARRRTRAGLITSITSDGWLEATTRIELVYTVLQTVA